MIFIFFQFVLWPFRDSFIKGGVWTGCHWRSISILILAFLVILNDILISGEQECHRLTACRWHDWVWEEIDVPGKKKKIRLPNSEQTAHFFSFSTYFLQARNQLGAGWSGLGKVTCSYSPLQEGIIKLTTHSVFVFRKVQLFSLWSSLVLFPSNSLFPCFFFFYFYGFIFFLTCFFIDCHLTFLVSVCLLPCGFESS